MTPAEILAIISSAQQLLGIGLQQWAAVKAAADAKTIADVEAAIAASGAALDAARAQIDADAA